MQIDSAKPQWIGLSGEMPSFRNARMADIGREGNALGLGVHRCKAIHAVRLKQKSKTKRKKKIAAAIYEYQADCDGEWGNIQVDFENGTAEIIRLADWDTIKTNRFANRAIAYLLILCSN